jgi:nitroreductase
MNANRSGARSEQAPDPTADAVYDDASIAEASIAQARVDKASIAESSINKAATPHLNPVAQAIATRRSVRAFRPDPIPRARIKALLELASRAPSGTNTQPWRVYVLSGQTLQRVVAALLDAYDDPQRDALYVQEYAYYPRTWFSPYIERRRKVGWDLYTLLGIGRTDKQRMHAQHSRNFRFFDAPVGLVFTIDRRLEIGSWLDYGMFLQNLMIAARSEGLDTCPQAAFTQFHRVLTRELSLSADEMVVCGMALGYAAHDALENTLQTSRDPVEAFTRFLD